MDKKLLTRREFLKSFSKFAGGILGVTALSCRKEGLDYFIHRHFLEMSEEEKKAFVQYLKRKYEKTYGRTIKIGLERALPNTLFGYGLDLTRCIGCRRCVYACVKENNQSRYDPQIHWIRVIRLKKGHLIDLENSEHYYHPEVVPEERYFYLPVQCQHCENPPCVKVCPVKATWKEPDGIVVVDYNWCIGCRYCMAACPYRGRFFNWAEPKISKEELNIETHYLGNRPRFRGVVEKCTFCIQRVRKNLYPVCVEVCPVGARKFGNLLDEESEISYLIRTKRVFRLKEDLNTQPKFFYFFAE